MKKTVSLRKNFHFRYVYQKGKSIANRQLVLYYKKSSSPTNRLGVSVSKKVGKSVVRSRVTRLIKESYRNMEDEIKSGYDLVLIARVSCNEASYHEVYRSLRHLLKKSDLLAKKETSVAFEKERADVKNEKQSET